MLMTPPSEPHGILAHYFCADESSRVQGALTIAEWDAGLDAYGSRLIPAREWIKRALKGQTRDEVCVTFDDGLKEAQTYALPALERRGLTAAWYPYTQVLVGVPHQLERDRWIRNHAYGSLEAFYAAWWKHVKAEDFATALPSGYLADRGYLTDIDRLWRYWRNERVTPDDYRAVMDALEGPPRFDPTTHWLTAYDLAKLQWEGHVVGLHTHTHRPGFDPVEWATASHFVWATTAAWPYGAYSDAGRDWLHAHGFVLVWGATMQGPAPWNTPRWSTGYWGRTPAWRHGRPHDARMAADHDG